MKKFYYAILTLAMCASAASARTIDHTQLQSPAHIALEPTAIRSTSVAAKAPAGAAVPHQWEAMGTGLYTDDLLTGLFKSVSVKTFEVEIECDAATEGYYRVVDPVTTSPYTDALTGYIAAQPTPRYLVIDARDPENVIIEPSDLGLVYNGEEMYTYSLSWLATTGEFTQEQIKNAGMTGTLSNGYITFKKAGALWLTTPTLDADGSGFSANGSASFRIALPGAKDYSFEVLGGSWCAYDGKAIVSVWAGGDIATIKAGVVTDPDDAAQVKAIELNPTLLTSQQGAFVELPANVAPRTKLYIMALGYDNAGKEQARGYTMVYADDSADTAWKTLEGKATFRDYIVSHAYGLTTSPYEVEVQESTVTPGRYRLVDPYASMRYNALTPSTHGSHSHYLYIDASDPDCVVLEEGPIGYITETDGDSRVSSRAARYIAAGHTKDEAKALGYGGKMKDGRITFPFDAYVYMGFLTEGPEYWMNVNFTQTATGYGDGPMYIDLSKALGVDDITADSDAPTAYYNLQGIAVEGDLAPGLYIRRQGNTATKVFVK